MTVLFRPARGRGADTSGPSRLRPFAALIRLSVVGLALAACQSEAADGEDAAAGEAGADDAATQVSGAPPMDPARQMAVMTELQSIQAELTPIREEAMANAELQAMEAALMAQVDAAATEIAPEYAEQKARFDSLVPEFEAARAAQDTATLQSLGTELQGLQMSIQQAQMQAVEQEDVAEALEEFREELFAAMREIAPRADSLMDRAEELNAEMEEAASGG